MTKVVLVQRDPDGWYSVSVRRHDDSLLDVAKCEFRPDAFEVAQKLRTAITRHEEWILSILDVSAGELRAS